METIDALKKIGNETEQDQMAMQVFGKSATELTGMINAGSKGLQEYANEAKLGDELRVTVEQQNNVYLVSGDTEKKIFRMEFVYK